MLLKKDLSDHSLGDIFRSVARNRLTGTLIVRSGEHESMPPRYIQFSGGQITYVSSLSLRGFRLGEILVSQKSATPADIQRALTTQDQEEQALGPLLIPQGTVTPDDIVQAIVLQFKSELHDLFLLVLILL